MMVDHRGTLTPDEHSALEFLLDGPAMLGARTEQFVRHPITRLYDTPNQTIAAAALADNVKGPRPSEVARIVNAKIARRLAERGWVIIDHGGLAVARVHRLAKPLPGGPGDGHAVVCSCGAPFASWADAEAHQAALEPGP